jgi:hypothetical protein
MKLTTELANYGFFNESFYASGMHFAKLSLCKGAHVT